jgi:hypothetical protein
MGINAAMLLTYLQAQKADEITRQTQDIAAKSTAQGDKQVEWANKESEYLLDKTKKTSDEQYGIGKKLSDKGDENTKWGEEEAAKTTQAGEDVYNTERDSARHLRDQAKETEAAARENRSRSKDQWQKYLDTYAPIEAMSAIDAVGGVYADDATFDKLADNYVSSISDPAKREAAKESLRSMRATSKAGAESAAGNAAGQMGKAYAAKEREMNRTLGARGVSAEKLAGMARMSNVQSAADTADAANAARTENLDKGVEDRYRQVGVGRKLVDASLQYENAAANNDNTSIQYENAATTSENSAITNLLNSKNTAQNLRQSGLPFYKDSVNAYNSAQSTLVSGENQASDMRNEANTWYNTSLNALNTQQNAANSVTNAGLGALSNNRQQSQMEKQNSAANAVGLGQLAGTAISAGAYFFK